MTEKIGYTYTELDHPAQSYVVIDFEWNQPIPWIKSSVDPKVLPGEIIEIGAVKVSLTGSGYFVSEPFHVMIKPICYTVMNRNVSKVTNKISSDLRYGLSFQAAYAEFVAWCGSDYILCGWGNSDLSILKSNLRFHEMNADLHTLFLDVQPLFARVAEGISQQRSVEYAVDFLKIPKKDDFHAAHRDAEYTGLILKELLTILDCSSDDRRDQSAAFQPISGLFDVKINHYLQNPDLHAESSIRTPIYNNWASCFDDAAKETVICPACGETLEMRLSWFRIKKSAYALWVCPNHNLIQGRMRAKKTPDGKAYAAVIIRLTNPASARVVEERYAEYLEYGHAGKPVPILSAQESAPEAKEDADGEVRSSREE